MINGPTHVENEGKVQTESESLAKLQGKRRGRCGESSANKVKFEEKEDMGLKALEDCARENCDGTGVLIQRDDRSVR